MCLYHQSLISQSVRCSCLSPSQLPECYVKLSCCVFLSLVPRVILCFDPEALLFVDFQILACAFRICLPVFGLPLLPNRLTLP